MEAGRTTRPPCTWAKGQWLPIDAKPALRKDDRSTFWSAEVPSYGVKVLQAGVTIKVLT